MKSETRLPPSRCLSCGTICDAATDVLRGHTPSPGDISICLYCGHLAAFDNDHKLRPLTDAEMHAVAGDQIILRLQAARLKTRTTK